MKKRFALDCLADVSIYSINVCNMLKCICISPSIFACRFVCENIAAKAPFSPDAMPNTISTH